MSSDIAKRIHELKLQLDEIYLSIEKLLFSKTSFLHYIILLNQSIKEKENIDLLSYYGLLKTFMPSDYSSEDPRRIYSIKEMAFLKANVFLPKLLNQAKLEMYALSTPSEENNPVIRRLTANFVEMHVTILRIILAKKNLTDQQTNYLEEKVGSLKTTVGEIEKLNIQEFISHIEWRLSRNLYPQLRSPMFTFFGKGKTNKRLIQEISNLFEDLRSKPLTAEALIGALFLINGQLIPLLHESLRNTLSHHINQYLVHIQGNSGNNKYDQLTCIQTFYTQAHTLAVTWPVVNSAAEPTNETLSKQDLVAMVNQQGQNHTLNLS